MLHAKWWKILGVVLLIYTFFAGMLVPLKPGIVKVAPNSVQTGETVSLEIEGYNSHFAAGEMRAWLKLDNERALAAESIDVLDDRRLTATFRIPAYLPVGQKVQDFAVILDNPVDGASVLPSAVFVTQDSVDSQRGEAAWVNQPVEHLHDQQGMTFPFRNILSETIRNTYFHVPLWLAMVLIFIGSVIFNIRFLTGLGKENEEKAAALIQIGVLFGLLGLITGAIWAKHTWGAYWNWDPKQNMTAVALLIYLAYFVLRGSFEDEEKRARISAVYSLFAFAALVPLIYVIPRMVDSLHPGAGGNPAFGSQDLDNTMRLVFYPAVIGWTLLGYWIATLVFRAHRLERRLLEA